MPELPDSFAPRNKARRRSHGVTQWYTITYRAVALWILAILVVALLVFKFTLPGQWEAMIRAIVPDTKSIANSSSTASRQARFTNLEGGVRIRKANQVQWSSANVSMQIDEGDTVQTLGDGLARIAFADGSLYVVKPDSLIVLEETGSIAEGGVNPSPVSVQVTSGVVDLSTSRTSGDSRVMFANAEARIQRESRAMVSNNPNTNSRQITLSKGTASLQRGAERVELGQYDQVSFTTPDSPLLKAKVVAPPVLLTPSNLAPVVLAGSDATDVEFTWSIVPTASEYRLRISNSPTFATTIYDQSLHSTSAKVSALKEGEYYWSVITVAAGQKESPPSEANRFFVKKQETAGELPLVVDGYVRHGRVIEVVGRTEPGATVLVNNESVFNINETGSFKHFTSPLPNSGDNLITVTAQNSKGKIAIVRKTINMQ